MTQENKTFAAVMAVIVTLIAAAAATAYWFGAVGVAVYACAVFFAAFTVSIWAACHMPSLDRPRRTSSQPTIGDIRAVNYHYTINDEVFFSHRLEQYRRTADGAGWVSISAYQEDDEGTLTEVEQ